MKIGLSIILLFVCSSFRLFAQDSLKVNSVLDVNRKIFHHFRVINSRLDTVLKDNIQQLVMSKNNLGKLKSEMYIFNFIMEFDSCGQFVSCRNEKVKYGNRKLNSISRDISSLISASSFEVKNTVLLSDSVYQIYKYELSFSFISVTKEFIFDELEVNSNPTTFYWDSPKGSVTFLGFTNCRGSSKD